MTKDMSEATKAKYISYQQCFGSITNIGSEMFATENHGEATVDAVCR